MIQFLKNMVNNLGIIGELLKYLWARRMWWLIPMVITLLVIAFAFMFAAASGLGPLIYTIF